MAELTRRQFLKVSGASLAGSSLALIGFSPTVALAEVREFKLARATETRNTCPYCSVSCGLLMYSLGDNAKNAKASMGNNCCSCQQGLTRMSLVIFVLGVIICKTVQQGSTTLYLIP